MNGEKIQKKGGEKKAMTEQDLGTQEPTITLVTKKDQGKQSAEPCAPFEPCSPVEICVPFGVCNPNYFCRPQTEGYCSPTEILCPPTTPICGPEGMPTEPGF